MFSANSDFAKAHVPTSGLSNLDLSSSGFLDGVLDCIPCAVVEIMWDEEHDTCA